jgi:hypothetical protein
MSENTRTPGDYGAATTESERVEYCKEGNALLTWADVMAERAPMNEKSWYLMAGRWINRAIAAMRLREPADNAAGGQWVIEQRFAPKLEAALRKAIRELRMEGGCHTPESEALARFFHGGEGFTSATPAFESAGQDEQKWAEFGRAAFAACAYLDEAVPLTVGSNDERIRWAADEILRLRERLREVAR